MSKNWLRDLKNHITDVWQNEISNVSLKASYYRRTCGQTDGQKKGLIGAQAYALPKNSKDKGKIKMSTKFDFEK